MMAAPFQWASPSQQEVSLEWSPEAETGIWSPPSHCLALLLCFSGIINHFSISQTGWAQQTDYIFSRWGYSLSCEFDGELETEPEGEFEISQLDQKKVVENKYRAGKVA